MLLSIAIRAFAVVHMAVYMRTLASVRAYTAMCTCVHCHVYDGKCADCNRDIGEMLFENMRLDNGQTWNTNYPELVHNAHYLTRPTNSVFSYT